MCQQMLNKCISINATHGESILDNCFSLENLMLSLDYADLDKMIESLSIPVSSRCLAVQCLAGFLSGSGMN